MAERILVIGDDPSILRGLQLNLGMEGYVVRSAMDGETGLALARTEKPDLVVVDVMLPRKGGLEVVREIRVDDPDLPVLILSAKGQETDKVAGLQLGADDYMVKPFSLKELLARIDALLRRRRSRGETGATRAVRKVGHVEVDLEARRATREIVSRDVPAILARSCWRGISSISTRPFRIVPMSSASWRMTLATLPAASFSDRLLICASALRRRMVSSFNSEIATAG